jgi:hypothetical protein
MDGTFAVMVIGADGSEERTMRFLDGVPRLSQRARWKTWRQPGENPGPVARMQHAAVELRRRPRPAPPPESILETGEEAQTHVAPSLCPLILIRDVRYPTIPELHVHTSITKHQQPLRALVSRHDAVAVFSVKRVRATPADGVNFIPYMKLLGVE